MESAQSSQNSKSDGGASSGDENTTTPSIKANEGSVNGDEANDESQAVKPVEVKMETDSAMDSSASSNGQADKAEESGSEQAANSRKRKAEDSISSGNESSAETPKPTSDNDVAPVLEAQTSDLSMPPKQTLGKGKRARIPNKRYSDIILSPQSLSRKSTFENGDKTSERLESESELNDTVEEMPPQVTTPKPLPPAPSSSAVKKPKLTIDISSPQYKMPMSQGWRRELVYRSSHDPAKKVNGDIYYHTPKGRKIRSMRELAEYLRQENSELTLDNFSFLREPIGFNDPEKEIVRPAKAWPKKQSKGGLKTSPKSSKGSPGLDGSTASPKNRTLTRNLGNFKVKLPPTKTKAEKQKAKEEEAAMETESPGSRRQTSRRTAKVPPNLEMDKPCQPCSIRCEGVLGMVPTLQCRLCLCLYHYECIGLSPLAQIQPFVCKNCQLEHGQNVVPSSSSINLPPLTPINTLKSMSLSQSSVLPKLQRIPRPGDPPAATSPQSSQELLSKDNVGSVVVPNMPRLLPLPHPKLAKDAPSPPKQTKIANSIENKSLVGSVTSWLPHSSTIQLDNMTMNRNSENEQIVAPRPQYVEYLGGRKFLIIPKHNVVSVSPASLINQSSQGGDNNNRNDDETNRKNEQQNCDGNDSGGGGDGSGVGDAMDVDKSNGGGGGVDEEVLTDKETTTADEERSETLVESPSKSAASRRTSKSSTTTNDGGGVSNKIDKSKFMDSYLQNLNYGYTTLLHVFQYLKVQDLLRAACVCRMWRDIANHPSLWRTVRMKNSQVHSFEGLANSLQKHGTVQLDLRKMLLPGGDDIWPEFSKAIKKVETLRKIELCRCPASVVESLLETNTDLEVINAVTIKCDKLNLDKLSNVKKLKEVRIKSSSTGLTLTSNITSLNELTSLMHLSLTSIKSLHELDLKVIALLSNLETLELGECNDFPENFGSDILLQLNKLEKLRLEKGQDNCHTFEILEAVKIMPKLEQLELINFDIKSGFDLALGACTNLKKLLIIPTYISQSATTNHMVLGGVLRLQKTISHFVWGITLELLRVTELFVDQCDDSDIKEKKEKKPSGGSGDSIPVLKPVPSIVNSDDSILPANDPPQVDILPLANLQKLLMKSLPTTRVKILKIPYHATWRQSITEFC